MSANNESEHDRTPPRSMSGDANKDSFSASHKICNNQHEIFKLVGRNRRNKNIMIAATATPDITKDKRRVTFYPFIEVFKIPQVDPEIKGKLWYSKCELFMIKLDLTRQVLIYKAIVGMNKKRAALMNPDDNGASPSKRARLQGSISISNEESAGTENGTFGKSIVPCHIPVVTA